MAPGRRGGDRRPLSRLPPRAPWWHLSQLRDQASRVHCTASTTMLITMRIMPIPGPSPGWPLTDDDCCDQMASMPSTDEIQQPTVHTQLSHQRLVTSAAAEASTPNRVEVEANSSGMAPPSPANIRHPG